MVLNIFRSQPEEKYLALAQALTQGQQVKEVHLYAQERVDYDQLLNDILASEKVYSWW